MLLLKQRSQSNRKQRKFPRYLDKIRACPCLICGQQAECAHLRMSSAEYSKVNGRDDKWVTPLCPTHHRLGPQAQHSMAEYRFWEIHAIDPLRVAKALWEARDDLAAMQTICVQVPIVRKLPKPQ